MDIETLETALRRLVCGMADQDIKSDKPFFYDGGRLLSEDVATLGMPSMLCLADRLSVNLGLGSMGFRFALDGGGVGFPLQATRDGSRDCVAFAAAAPVLYEVFVTDVRECRLDLALLFERAARVIDPAFRLESITTYLPALKAHGSAGAEPLHFDLG